MRQGCDPDRRSPFALRIDHRLDHLTAEAGSSDLDWWRGAPPATRAKLSAIESLARSIEAGTIDLVAIHDGARPFMTLELLEACIEAAIVFGGAVPGLPPEAPLYQIG